MFCGLLLASVWLTVVAMFETKLDLHWDMWKKIHNKNYETSVGSNAPI